MCSVLAGTLALTAVHSGKRALYESAAVLYINRSNAAGNSKRLYNPGVIKSSTSSLRVQVVVVNNSNHKKRLFIDPNHKQIYFA